MLLLFEYLSPSIKRYCPAFKKLRPVSGLTSGVELPLIYILVLSVCATIKTFSQPFCPWPLTKIYSLPTFSNPTN